VLETPEEEAAKPAATLSHLVDVLALDQAHEEALGQILRRVAGVALAQGKGVQRLLDAIITRERTNKS